MPQGLGNISKARADALYVAQPTGDDAAFGAPSGTLSRATFDSSTVTLDDLAQIVAALITDLQALNALQVLPAPVNTVAPSISGTAEVGQTLTANTGTWTGHISGYTYQWKRGGSNIGSATNSTYTLVSADYNTVITVTVTATGNGGNTSATSAGTSAVAGIAPVNTVAPSISGTVTVGQTLTLNLGTWTGTPTPTLAGELRYVSDETVVASLSSNGTYVIGAADIGETLYLRVVGTNAVGSATANSSATATITTTLSDYLQSLSPRFWFEADVITGVNNGDLLSSWNDSGAAAINVSASGSDRPSYITAALNEQPIVRFSGSQYMASASTAILGLTGTDTATVYMVMKENGVKTDNVAFAIGADSNRFAAWMTFNNNVFLDHGHTTSGGQIYGAQPAGWDAAWHFVELWRSGTAGRIYVDGVLVLSGTLSDVLNAASAVFQIGAWNGGYTMNGDIALIVGFDTAHTDQQRQTVRELAQTKYFTYQIVFDGDSMTLNYPTQALALLPAPQRTANYAAGGQKLTAMSADAAAQIDVLFNAYYPSNVLVAWGGVNDAYYDSVNAQTIYDRLVNYTQARRAAGWKVVVCTLTPVSASWAVSANYEATRTAVNNLIRANSNQFDGIADLAANSTIGAAGASDNTTYYNGDKVHLTTAGDAIVAQIVADAVTELI